MFAFDKNKKPLKERKFAILGLLNKNHSYKKKTTIKCRKHKNMVVGKVTITWQIVNYNLS